jgi:hypothetical protein
MGIELLIFYFKFKANLLFKLQKNHFQQLKPKKSGLSTSMGHLLQITDSGKPIN